MPIMRSLLLLISLVLLSCNAHESPPSATIGSSTNDTGIRLIRISEEACGLVTSPGSRLVAEIRGDSPADRAFINRLWEQHHASFPEDERVHYGPDSSFTQIELVHGSDRIVVGSWHTAEKTSPQLFASHSGLSVLGHRTRAEALAAEPEAYRLFRSSFDAIVDEVTSHKKP